MYHDRDLKHLPTQRQADIRRAIELERWGVLIALGCGAGYIIQWLCGG